MLQTAKYFQLHSTCILQVVFANLIHSRCVQKLQGLRVRGRLLLKMETKHTCKTDDLPFPLFVGRIIRTQKVQLVLADDTEINVTARAQIIIYTSCNSISHKLFGCFFLGAKRPCKLMLNSSTFPNSCTLSYSHNLVS